MFIDTVWLEGVLSLFTCREAEAIWVGELPIRSTCRHLYHVTIEGVE